MSYLVTYRYNDSRGVNRLNIHKTVMSHASYHVTSYLSKVVDNIRDKVLDSNES